MTVGQPPIVQNLKQRIEDIRMCLLDLVKQNDRVGFPPDRFGQLPAFVIAHIPRRRTNETRDRMLLHVFRHIEPDHIRLIVEQKLSQRTRQFGFSHPGRPQKDERPNRTVGIFEP